MNSKVLVGLFLAFLMVSSIAGFVIDQASFTNQGKVKYLGRSFAQTDQGYLTYLGNDQILISSDPRNVQLYQGLESLSLEELNSAGKIYFTFNPSDNLQNTLSYFNAAIVPRFNKNMIISCKADSPECADLPIITCADATESIKIIQLDLADSPSLTYNNNCLLIQGNQATLPNLFDSLILDLLLL